MLKIILTAKTYTLTRRRMSGCLKIYANEILDAKIIEGARLIVTSADESSEE